MVPPIQAKSVTRVAETRLNADTATRYDPKQPKRVSGVDRGTESCHSIDKQLETEERRAVHESVDGFR